MLRLLHVTRKENLENILKEGIHVRKLDHIILNFVFSVHHVAGAITGGHDPDGIAVEARFVDFDKALRLIVYEDVRGALDKWRKGEHERLMHIDLRVIMDG